MDLLGHPAGGRDHDDRARPCVHRLQPRAIRESTARQTLTSAPPSTRRLLLVLGFLSFASAYSSVVAIPLLLDIADEFRISAGAAGAVVAAYGLPGILVPLLIGPYSDRRGHKRVLVGGSILQAIGTLLAAVAPSFELLVLSRLLGGIGWSLIYPNISAVVGGSAESGSKGRALSAIIGISTMATIVGVPIAGLVADATSWRSSLGLVAVLGFASAIVVWRALPDDGVHGAGAGTALLYRRIFANPSASAALVSSFLGSVFWFTWVTFFVVYFQQTYFMSLSAASTLGLTLGIGILVGKIGRAAGKEGGKNDAWADREARK